MGSPANRLGTIPRDWLSQLMRTGANWENLELRVHMGPRLAHIFFGDQPWSQNIVVRCLLPFFGLKICVASELVILIFDILQYIFIYLFIYNMFLLVSISFLMAQKTTE